jgi:hypothetical protein
VRSGAKLLSARSVNIVSRLNPHKLSLAFWGRV